MFTIDDICKQYGKKQVLDHISFHIHEGECVGLLGINGSGKSTLLNILSGGVRANHGTYGFRPDPSLQKTQMKRAEYDLSHTVSFLPQENPLIEELSGWDNLKLWFSGSSRALKNSQSTDILNALGVDAFLHQKVKTMSGGMKKRLSLAICMLEHPDLLLLDEPLAALDLLCKKGILNYLKQYTANGGSILIATHEESALSICDRIFILKNGFIRSCDNRDYVAQLSS